MAGARGPPSPLHQAGWVEDDQDRSIRLLDALDALVAAELIDRGPRLEFVHPIVRAAIYDEIPPGTRSALHLQAAGLLAAEGAEIDAVAAQPGRANWPGSEDVEVVYSLAWKCAAKVPRRSNWRNFPVNPRPPVTFP